MNSELIHIDDYLGGLNDENSSSVDLHLWVNSDQVSFHQVELPEAPKSKWMSLIPWILEDELLLPVEEMHLAICSVDSARQASVVAVPKKEMYRLQLLLEEQSSKIRSWLPDVLALPLEEGFITLAAAGDRILVRTDQYQGFSGVPDFVWQVLALRRSQGEVFQIQCFGMSEDSVPEWARDSSSFNNNSINWQFADAPPTGANLLTGHFRQKANRSGFKFWMPSIGFSGIALCLLLSLALVDHVKTGRELLLINQQLLREFEANFGASASSPERVQLEGAQLLRDRELRYLSVVDSIFPMAESLDAALSSCSGCDMASVQLDIDGTTLVMKQDANAVSRLRSLEGYNLTTGAPNEQQQIVVNLKRQAL